MGARAGFQRIAIVLKWGAAGWLLLGIVAFFIGVQNKAVDELLIIDGLIFGLPALLGFVLAYVVAGFGRLDVSTSSDRSTSEIAKPPEEVSGGAGSDIPLAATQISHINVITRERVIAWGLLIGPAVALSVYVAQIRSSSDQVSAAFGELFGSILVFALLGYFVARKKDQRGRDRVWIFVGVATLVFAVKIAHEQYVSAEEEKATLESSRVLAKTFDKELARVRGVAGSESLAQPDLVHSPDLRSEANASASISHVLTPSEFLLAINAVMQRSFARSAVSEAQFDANIKELHIESALAPSSLASPEAIKSSERNVKRWRQLIDGAEKVDAENVKNVDLEILALPVSQSLRQRFLPGYEKGKANRQKFVAPFFSINRRLADKSLEVLSFMRDVTKNEGVNLQEGRLVFKDTGELNQYNSFIAEIQTIAKEEDIAEKQLLAFQEASVANMKNAQSAP
jgi:hypothetical protein